MDVKEIIAILCKAFDIDEVEACRRMQSMMDCVLKKDLHAEIIDICIDGVVVVVCLKSGIRVKFDPSLPVPLWQHPEGVSTINLAQNGFSGNQTLERIRTLERDIVHAVGVEARRKIQLRLDKLVAQRGAESVDELKRRIHAAMKAKRGGEPEPE